MPYLEGIFVSEGYLQQGFATELGGMLMKTREEALEYGLSFPDTYRDAPFHDQNWQLVRYSGNKKAFLWTYEKDEFINLNVKVDPERAFFWRDIYKSVIP